ncbi:MAG: hypothetical protein GEU28_10970 [Dehalococcoidia bacterium]|nr:hypothetical protein [Dehalococcoidia bacterium]
MDFTRVTNWLGRLLRLDNTAFDEIRSDPSGLVAGVAVVAVTNLIIGIGTYLYATFADLGETGDLLLRAVIIGTVVQTVVWMAWPGVTYLLLTSVYRGTANVQQLIATMGFAYVAAVITFLMLITFLDWPFAILGMVAAFVLSQYAIAAASNAGSLQITMANLAGFAAFAVIMAVVVELSAGDEPGDYAFANGIWFLDSTSGEVADGIGSISSAGGGEIPDAGDFESGDFDDVALDACLDLEEQGQVPEGSCEALE